MLSTNHLSIVGSVLSLLSAAMLSAGTTPVPDASVPDSADSIPPWVPSFQIGSLHQFDADWDTSGSFAVSRFNLRMGINRVFDRDRIVGLSFGYGHDHYQFNNTPVDPWSDIHTLSMSVPIRWALADRWSLFAIPTIRSSGESGANFSDSLSGGILGGVSYSFGDHLKFGPGFGVLTQLEDSASVFPILLIKWNITDTIQVETGRGFGASQGPGLMLSWQATDKWKLALGSRYERLRFRLDDKGSAPNGVGEEKGVPVYLGASYAFSKYSELSLYAGVKFGGTLALDNFSGNTLSNRDYDITPFAGITWKWGF